MLSAFSVFATQLQEPLQVAGVQTVVAFTTSSHNAKSAIYFNQQQIISCHVKVNFDTIVNKLLVILVFEKYFSLTSSALSVIICT